VFDDTSVITVQVKGGTLLSATDEAIFQGANMCMIGREVLQFGVATLVDPQTYELSHLLRGRQGTEWAIPLHVNDELFVMLDDALVEVTATPAERGKAYLYKTVTIGSDLTKVDPKSVAVVGQNTLPWSVTNLQGVKADSGDFVLNWFERPRFVNSLIDYNDVTHDHDFGGFLVAIYDDIDEEPVRTMFVYDSTYTYKVADQVTDFGAEQTGLTVKVFQVSNIYGGGQPVTLTI
jgi:hypothetical protein